jgi:hypothetical protein
LHHYQRLAEGVLAAPQEIPSMAVGAAYCACGRSESTVVTESLDERAKLGVQLLAVETNPNSEAQGHLCTIAHILVNPLLLYHLPLPQEQVRMNRTA